MYERLDFMMANSNMIEQAKKDSAAQDSVAKTDSTAKTDSAAHPNIHEEEGI